VVRFLLLRVPFRVLTGTLCFRPDVNSVSSTVSSSTTEVGTGVLRQLWPGAGEAERAAVPEQQAEPGLGMPPEQAAHLAEAASTKDAAEWTRSPKAERNEESASTGANFTPGCPLCPPTSRKHRSPKCGVCSTANAFPPYGIKAICGRRPRMEDAYKAVPFLMDVVVPGFFSDILPPRLADHVKNHVKSASNSPDSESGSDNDENPGRHLAPYTETLHFFGVFDGHGGAEAALHCAQTLHQRIREALVAPAAAAEPEGGLEEAMPQISSSPHPVESVRPDIGVGAALALSIAEQLSQEVPPEFEAQLSTEPAKELRLSAIPGPLSSDPLQPAAQGSSADLAPGPELSESAAEGLAPRVGTLEPASGKLQEAATPLPGSPALAPARHSARGSTPLAAERRSAFAAPGLASPGGLSAGQGPWSQQGDAAWQSNSEGLVPRHGSAVLASEQTCGSTATRLRDGDAASQGTCAAPGPGPQRTHGGLERSPSVLDRGLQLPHRVSQEAQPRHDTSQEASSPDPGESPAALRGDSRTPDDASESGASAGPGRKAHLLINSPRQDRPPPESAGESQGSSPEGVAEAEWESPKSGDSRVPLPDSSGEESPSVSPERREDDQWTFTAEKFEIAFLEAFCRTDEEFAKADNAALVGTTAVVALVGTRKLYVANCGMHHNYPSMHGNVATMVCCLLYHRLVMLKCLLGAFPQMFLGRSHGWCCWNRRAYRRVGNKGSLHGAGLK
jgi:hypothetical protein